MELFGDGGMGGRYPAGGRDRRGDLLLSAALERVKRKVDARHYQIFDCAVLKEWSAAKVAKELGVNIAHVYLVKHRISALLKREVKAIEGVGRLGTFRLHAARRRIADLKVILSQKGKP